MEPVLLLPASCFKALTRHPMVGGPSPPWFKCLLAGVAHHALYPGRGSCKVIMLPCAVWVKRRLCATQHSTLASLADCLQIARLQAWWPPSGLRRPSKFGSFEARSCGHHAPRRAAW